MRLSRLRRVLDQRYHSGGAPLAGVNVHRYSTTRLSCSAPLPAAALAAARRAARPSCFASPPVRQLGRDLQDVSVVSSCKPAGGGHHRRRLACDPKSIVGTCDQGGGKQNLLVPPIQHHLFCPFVVVIVVEKIDNDVVENDRV